MPFDIPTAGSGLFQDARPFVAHRPPPRLRDLSRDDEAALIACESGWAQQRGPIAPQDDELSDRWSDDERPPPRARLRGVNMDELTAAVLAALADVPGRDTVRALMVAAGHLTHVPSERRYLLSAAAIRAGIGRNVRPRRGFRFPIVFPEHVAMVARSLDWTYIKARVAALANASERTAHLARWHRYLPRKALALLAGCSGRTMERALAGLDSPRPRRDSWRTCG